MTCKISLIILTELHKKYPKKFDNVWRRFLVREIAVFPWPRNNAEHRQCGCVWPNGIWHARTWRWLELQKVSMHQGTRSRTEAVLNLRRRSTKWPKPRSTDNVIADANRPRLIFLDDTTDRFSVTFSPVFVTYFSTTMQSPHVPVPTTRIRRVLIR